MRNAYQHIFLIRKVKFDVGKRKFLTVTHFNPGVHHVHEDVEASLSCDVEAAAELVLWHQRPLPRALGWMLPASEHRWRGPHSRMSQALVVPSVPSLVSLLQLLARGLGQTTSLSAAWLPS